MIPFAEWTPDQPALKNPGATFLENAYPHARAHKEFRGLNAATGAMDARVQGAIAAVDFSGNPSLYGGDITKLYQLIGQVWTDSSKGGGYNITDEDWWEFTQFGENILATNKADDVQFVLMGGVTFADRITSTRKPKARTIATMKEFVLLGDTDDPVEGNQSQRVWNSARNNSADFDPDVATLCTFKDLAGPWGRVQKIIGGEFAMIFQERRISRMTFIGPPPIMQVDNLEENRGLLAQMGAVKVGRFIYFLSHDGFYRNDGLNSHPIGQERIDTFFFNDLKAGAEHRISAAADPQNPFVLWAYPSGQSTMNQADSIILYNWHLDKWGFGRVDTEMLLQDISRGFTLDGLDVLGTLDQITIPLDSRSLTGGDLSLAAFDLSHQLAYFNGSPLTAILETPEEQIHEPQRAYLSGVRPIVDNASGVTIQVATRDEQTDLPVLSAPQAVNDFGIHDFEEEGRYHRFRVTIPGGFDHALGVDPESVATGHR